MTTSSSSARTPPQPKSCCDNFSRSRINRYLTDLHDELRDDYPELHTYMTENIVVHMGSGKKIVARLRLKERRAAGKGDSRNLLLLDCVNSNYA